MVYRIHFTLEDLARTRVAQPPPLMELSAAVRTLQDRNHPIRFGAWRRAALTGLTPKARMVLDLIPPGGWAPTFLTAAAGGSPDEMLERVRATSRPQIRKDLAHVAEQQPLPPWAHHLADDSDLLRRLCDSLDHVHAVLLSPVGAHHQRSDGRPRYTDAADNHRWHGTPARLAASEACPLESTRIGDRHALRLRRRSAPRRARATARPLGLRSRCTCHRHRRRATARAAVSRRS
ncbi:hypothetical protein NKH18_26910 [Streptomyces sp. M10(2022)]